MKGHGMKTSIMLAALTFLLAAPVGAVVPNQMNVQGRLLDAGSPMTGSHPADFKIFDASSAGNLLWSESSSLTVQGGIFSTTLGSTIPIPTIVFSAQPPWRCSCS